MRIYPPFDLNPNIIGPKSPKQYDFMHTDADITVFGGAAGAGKSYLGVLDFLKHVNDPNFRGCMVRRTTPQLKGPGGLHEKAEQLFKLIDKKVRWRDKEHHFLFSSGAKIYLRHFENPKDQENFQGWEVSEFLVDEGQQFEEAMVVYLTSRMRNPKCTVKPHMKITCNPDYDSFLRHWLEWWLDPNTGIPIPERDGVTRYFIRVNGKMVWGSSKQDVIDRYGKAEYPSDHEKQVKPMSFKFISANVYDNPILCKAQPEYVGWLEGLGRVERDRLLHGSWLAREEGTGYFKNEWVTPTISMRPLTAQKRVRAWDISGTMPSDTNPNPDWTAGVLMSKDRNSIYTVEDVVRDRRRHGGVFDLILETAKHDGDDVQIIIPCDPGAAGKAYAAQLIRDLSAHGYYARMKQTNKSKVTRFAPFAAVAEAGGVQVVTAEWNDYYFSELERFDGSRNVKDDMVDATSDAFNALSTDIHIPDFIVPEMKQENPFKLYR